MNHCDSIIVEQIAEAASEFQRRSTGHAPKAITVLLSEDTLVITLYEALTPAEKSLAMSSDGAAQMQEFHRQLFSTSSDALCREVSRITGRLVRESALEVEPTTGSIVHAFTSGTVVQIFLLDGRSQPFETDSVPTAGQETFMHAARPDTDDVRPLTRDSLIMLLNEDLAREYQAVISYVVYSQVLKGPQYMNIAAELERHAAEELAHALLIAGQIDYLGGMPLTVAKPVRTSPNAEDMLRFDLESENETIGHYRQRVRQCEALGEYAVAEHIRDILVQEQDHQIALANALGVAIPDVTGNEQLKSAAGVMS